MGTTRFVSNVCVHALEGLVPLKMDCCVNQLCAGRTSTSVSGDPLMVSSNKNDDDGSFNSAHMLSGTNCASFSSMFRY